MVKKIPRMDYEDPKGETDEANPKTIRSFRGNLEPSSSSSTGTKRGDNGCKTKQLHITSEGPT